MPIIQSFRELKTYQRARLEARRIFAVTKSFPAEERYSLTDQIRRSSRAVGAMLGEAWARRRYEGVFVNKLSEALGEAIETEVWLDHALDAGYLTTKEHLDLTKSWESIGGMLHTMIEKAPSFCGGRKS
jgi:four helix bundle protein